MINTSQKIVGLAELKKLVVRYRSQGRPIAFTNGCFDILHWGHVSYLQAAKRNLDRVLIVGLNSDRSVRSLGKGLDRPIIPHRERAKLLAALMCVDHVVIFEQPTPAELIKAVKPDILIKGADWKGKAVAGADVVEAIGGKVEFIKYIQGLSTTNIVEKVRKAC